MSTGKPKRKLFTFEVTVSVDPAATETMTHAYVREALECWCGNLLPMSNAEDGGIEGDPLQSLVCTSVRNTARLATRK